MESNNYKEPGEEGQGRINITSREGKKADFNRLLKKIGRLLLLVLLSSFITLFLIKNYVDKNLVGGKSVIFTDNDAHAQLIKIINQNNNYSKVADEFVQNLVGVSALRDDFYLNDPQKSTTGILFDTAGNILVPSWIIGTQSVVYVRTVQGAGNSIKPAAVVGTDLASGISMVNVKGLTAAPYQFTESNAITMGENVLVLGAPFGNRETANLTSGIVHSRNSLIRMDDGSGNATKIRTLIVSAPVYPGNDGGACITTEGGLIGMVSGVLSRQLGTESFSAVIPHEELKVIGDNIINRITQRTFSLGVTGRTIYYEPLKADIFYVLDVAEGSTAHRGGIKPTDIILKINGIPVSPNLDIDSPLQGKNVGDTILVEILRMEKTMELTMKVY